MIFVTVGDQMPFERLIRTVDEWAAVNHRHDVFAQISDGDWHPTHIPWTAHLEPGDFRRLLFDADVVITHAGMGTMITALEFGRPIIVMPRRGDLKETRNDHQLGTARAFAEARHVTVAWDEHELSGWLDRLDSVPEPQRIPAHATLPLLTAVRDFIQSHPPSMDIDDTALTFHPPRQDEDLRRAA